jgi:hypothetical protein
VFVLGNLGFVVAITAGDVAKQKKMEKRVYVHVSVPAASVADCFILKVSPGVSWNQVVEVQHLFPYFMSLLFGS